MALDRAPLRQRAAALTEAGQEPLADKNLKDLNEDLLQTLRDDLGLELGEGNSLPAGDPPRIFVTAKDENGKEVLRSPAEAGFPIGSLEFWQQVRLGNVFAYPAGEKAPVQLGAAENRIGKMALTASEPLTPETFPAPAVRPLTGLRKWLRRLTFGLMYRKEARAIREARASHGRFVEALRGHGPGRETAIDAEKKRMAEIREQAREKVRQRRLKGLVDAAKIAVQKKEHGLRNHLSIYKAEPEFLPVL